MEEQQVRFKNLFDAVFFKALYLDTLNQILQLSLHCHFFYFQALFYLSIIVLTPCRWH